jgi:putative FmdB family regulatory protein
MTTYSYRCRTCGARFDSNTRSLTSCPSCLGRNIVRDYSSVQIGVSAFKPHFNHAVGAYVSTSREFDDMLKLRSEENGSQITRIDPGEVEPIRSHDDILDTQARTIHDRGINPSSLTE